ncbi:MAG: hypothetical protein L3J83_00640 [Proteobacteria bacterium]|nr:hypothetical protein [Pseudomonadota bacterium]
MKKEQIRYLLPTPAGAYYFAQEKSNCWQRDALAKLFSQAESPVLSSETLIDLFGNEDSNGINEQLKECEALKLIQIVDQKITAPEGDLVTNISDMISVFSNHGKVLLSDSQGFSITNVGFPVDMIEEISVLSADIAIMHKRRALEINKNLGLTSQAWSIVDASGNSCLGFWPINIEDEVFVLAIEGTPFFNHPSFVTLVWILYLRYGKK